MCLFFVEVSLYKAIGFYTTVRISRVIDSIYWGMVMPHIRSGNVGSYYTPQFIKGWL